MQVLVEITSHHVTRTNAHTSRSCGQRVTCDYLHVHANKPKISRLRQCDYWGGVNSQSLCDCQSRMCSVFLVVGRWPPHKLMFSFLLWVIMTCRIKRKKYNSPWWRVINISPTFILYHYIYSIHTLDNIIDRDLVDLQFKNEVVVKRISNCGSVSGNISHVVPFIF